MKKMIAIVMVIVIISQVPVFGEESHELNIDSKSCVLMESRTGMVLYENNQNEKLSPASITKIMTLVLIFDAIHSGKIKLTDVATTSAYAKSMGGSQVFLEEGETQTVETLIKCIIIASGNDASVVMAEMINNTHFIDCCGLTDSDDHYTTAKDVALMSRELIEKYPEIFKYSTIWMESITHKTKAGEKEFVLSNTNKLLKINQYVKGLKTGSTSKAKYCVSTVAEKDGVQLIAVVMAAPDYKIRFKESEKLINYGFSNCKVYTDNDGYKTKIKVTNGKKDKVDISTNRFSYVDTKGRDLSKVTKKVFVNKKVKAPVKKNQKVGYIEYYLNDKSIGKSDIVSVKNVEKADYFHTIKSFGLRLLQLQYS